MGIFHLPVAALLVIALLPAGYVLWIGRRLARRVDDTTFPEQLAAEAPRRLLVLATAMAVLFVTAGRHLMWAIPVLVVARIAAAYPLRRVLYRETWSVAAYLSFFLRLTIGIYGFWVFLAATPSLTAAGGQHWMLSVFLAFVLLIWERYYPDVLRWLVKASPVTDPRLIWRFEQIVHTAGLPMPRFEQVAIKGGVFANAVALPSLRRPGVLVSDTLLARLDENEVIAICAHEIAHLEHYNAAQITRLQRATIGLIILTAVVTPAAQRMFPGATWAILIAWALAVLMVLIWRAQDRQKHETESDLRAVALTGNPDALIAALTKLHLIARVPRRIEQAIEERATHPSLARRIQGIRNASGSAASLLAEDVTIASIDPGRSVTFEPTRLVWKDGESSLHAFSYTDLKELRLSVKPGQPTALIAVDRHDRRWELPVGQQEVDRVNGVLNLVDSTLGLPLARKSTTDPTLARLLGFAVLSLTWCMGHIVAGLVSLLMLSRPLPAISGAAAAAGLGAALLVFRDGLSTWHAGGPFDVSLALAAFAAAAVLLTLAIRRPADGNPDALKLAAVLGVCAVLAWAAVLLHGRDFLSLHRAVRDFPAAVVLSLSAGTAFAFFPAGPHRWIAAVLLAFGFTGTVLGSVDFRDRFGHDPFVATSAPMQFRDLPKEPTNTFSVPFYASSVRVSPGGSYVALSAEDDYERIAYHVGAPGTELRRVDADEAIFISADRLMLLDVSGEDATLSEWDMGTSTPLWERRLTGIRDARLWFDSQRGRWDFAGVLFSGGILGIHGQAGGQGIAERRWKAPDNAGSPLMVSGPAVLLGRPEIDTNLLTATSFWKWGYLLSSNPLSTRWHFETVSEEDAHDGFSSRVDANCPPGLSHRNMAVCYSFDGISTRFFGMTADNSPVGLGSLPGRFYSYGMPSTSWINGWWETSAIALSLDDRTVWRPAPDAACVRCAAQLSGSGNYVAAIAQESHGSRVSLFRTGTADPAR